MSDTSLDELHAENYTTRREEIAGWPVNIATYQIGDVFHCAIDNVSPGAQVARAHADTAEAAEASAREKANRRLGRTQLKGELPPEQSEA